MVKRIVSIVLSIAILGGLGFMVYSNVQEGIEKKKKELEKQKKLKTMDRRLIVGVTPINRADVHRAVHTTGTLVADSQATVFSLVPGIIKSLKVDEGSEVKKGDILARLDASKMMLGYRQARAGLAQAKLNLDNMKINFNRMKNLYDQKAIPKSEFERVDIGYKVARQQVNQARAAVNMASSTWSDATLKAPIDGTVVMKAVEKGDLMTSSQGMKTSPLLVIAKLGTMKVDIHVLEKYIPFLKKGLKAEVKVDAYNHVFHGTIDKIGQMLDPVTKTLKVSVVIPNTDLSVTVGDKKRVLNHPLKIGMFARVSLILEKRPNRLVVPVDAIVKRDGFDFVYVYDKGVARQRLVKRGVTTRGAIEIVKGLTEGEKLIILGHRAVFEGQSVRLMKEDPFKFYKSYGKVAK